MADEAKKVLEMKFAAVLDLRQQIIMSKLEKAHRAEDIIVKTILLANGAALVIFASLFGSLVKAHVDINLIKFAAAFYFLGLVSAAMSTLTISIVNMNAPGHHYDQYMKFINGQQNLSEFTDYGFSTKGKWQFWISSGASAALFIIASLTVILSLG